jgi:hypothetical protein
MLTSFLILAASQQIPSPSLHFGFDNLPMKAVVTKSLAIKLSLKNIGDKSLVFPELMPFGQCCWISNKPDLPAASPLPDVMFWPIPTKTVAVGNSMKYDVHWDKTYDLKRAKKGKYEIVLTFSTMRNNQWTGDAPTQFEESFAISLVIGDKGLATVRGPFWPSKRPPQASTSDIN